MTPIDVDQPDDSQGKEPGPSRVHTIRERYLETYRRAQIDANTTEVTPASTSTSKKKVAPKNLIRTSAADRTLDSMFPVVPSNKTPPQPPPRTQARTRTPVEDETGGGEEQPGPSQRRDGRRKINEIKESVVELTSIKDLRKSVVVKEHQGISLT